MTTPATAGRYRGVRVEPGYLVNKVPEVTRYFWLIVVLLPTVGTTSVDQLDRALGRGTTDTTLVAGVVFLASLVLQVRAGRYLPGIYWTTVALAGLVGPLLVTDLVHRYGVPAPACAVALVALLAAAFLGWFTTERTLSLHTIRTPRREAWYWVAVLLCLSLGAAVTDLLSTRLDPGRLGSLLVPAAGVAAVAVAHRSLRVNGVLAFWLALVLTWPFGSALGDHLSRSIQDGAPGVGSAAISVIFLGAVLALVTYLAVTRVDLTDDEQYDEEPVATESAAAEAGAHHLHP